MSGRLAYLDPAGGLSGDIFLAAMVSAGVDPAGLEEILRGLDLGPWSLERERVQVFGLNATRIRFVTEPSPPHRHYAHIRDAIIGPARIPEPVRDKALAAFAALAQAESKAHGVEIEKVHFHEVGADDSILDLVGAAACLYLAGVEDLVSGPVPLSRGVGRAGHGLLPLPSPATLELLKGRPVWGSGSPTEMVTPTGAAVLTLASSFGELPAMVLEAVGCGVGSRTPETGLTRVCLGAPLETARLNGVRGERSVFLTTTIDDMNPEFYGPLMEKLFAAGALDVTLESIQMKKNRPGTRLEVLAPPELAEGLAAIVLEDSTTLGLRWRIENRYCLERTPGRVEVEGISVGGKWVVRPSGRREFRPEFEDCRQAAQGLGLPVGRVYELALMAAQKE